MLARHGWSPETPGLFSAAVPSGQVWHYLVVERLPDGAWDWAAWGPAAGPARGPWRGQRKNAHCVHGMAPTAAQGMVAAEHAAAMLGADLVALQRRPSSCLQSAAAEIISR